NKFGEQIARSVCYKLHFSLNCYSSFSNPINYSDTSDSVIALSVLVGILCGLLTVSVIVHIYCFIRKKSSYTVNKQTKADDDIAMQVCEPYEIHKTKQSEKNEGVYDECQTSPDD
uniref:Uncharacterized protein n=1 Tax=Amphimedon queenslandica TaxID=400682 RepID=A0A1X7T7G9_AMPQE